MILDDGGDATNFCQTKYPNFFKNLIGNNEHLLMILLFTLEYVKVGLYPFVYN